MITTGAGVLHLDTFRVGWALFKELKHGLPYWRVRLATETPEYMWFRESGLDLFPDAGPCPEPTPSAQGI